MLRYRLCCIFRCRGRCPCLEVCRLKIRTTLYCFHNLILFNLHISVNQQTLQRSIICDQQPSHLITHCFSQLLPPSTYNKYSVRFFPFFHLTHSPSTFLFIAQVLFRKRIRVQGKSEGCMEMMGGTEEEEERKEIGRSDKYRDFSYFRFFISPILSHSCGCWHLC
jgi:hypothetical protein